MLPRVGQEIICEHLKKVAEKTTALSSTAAKHQQGNIKLRFNDSPLLGINTLHMENKATLKEENEREQSAGERYRLFDEKTLNFFLYDTKEVRVLDVNKLKRKAENEQESSYSKRQKTAADLEEPRLTNAIRSFPDEVQLCMSSIPGASYGVCAKEHIPLGTWIGPYEGRRVTPQRLSPADSDSAYLWEIFKDGKLSHFLDGSDEENSSWMRFIRCARHIKEQNLYAFQYCGNIFYRAFKEILPGRELLVWYDDKYPQFYGIPLGMQDYEFFRESVTSSFSRGPPKLSSTSTQVRSSAQESKPYSLICPRENPHTGNFRVPSTRPVQPRLVRPTSSVGNAFGREQHGAAGIRAGPRFTGPLRGEKNRTETSLIPTSVCDGQSTRNFAQRSLMSNNNVHPLQTRSNKDIMTIEKVSLPANSRSGIPQRKVSTRVTSPQLINNDQQVSPPTSEGKALKSGNTSEHPMPALHPHLPQLAQTSGISLEEFGMWRCRQCLKTFTQRVSLQMHECSQSPEKPYQCGQCTLSFATPSDLRSHVDLHINDKLYKCGFCSRTFSGATTLNNHIRTHTGEKPFNCEKCNKPFSQTSHLARHQRVPGECI